MSMATANRLSQIAPAAFRPAPAIDPEPMQSGTALFAAEGLAVAPRGNAGAPIIEDVSVALWRGGALGIVGESGSGKSLTCLAMTGLLPSGLVRTAGTVHLDGVRLSDAPERMRAARGRRLAMVFQDPVASLNPMQTVGGMLAGLLRLHRGLDRSAARDAAGDLLAGVGLLPRHLRSYPHELSGGQSQRVMIAAALTGEPDVLVADEPTTALDVTTQAQILDLLERLRAERGMGLVVVSHDFGVIARAAEDVAVMYAGRVVETAPVRELLRAPRHPYSAALLTSIPPDRGAMPPPRPPAREPAAAVRPGAGCAYAPRCPRASDLCRTTRPPRAVPGAPACHHPLAT